MVFKSDHDARDEAVLQKEEKLWDFKIKFVWDLIWSKQFTASINRVYCYITQGFSSSAGGAALEFCLSSLNNWIDRCQTLVQNCSGPNLLP